MKKIFIILFVFLLCVSCSMKDSGNIRPKKYDQVIEDSRNNINSAIIIWKYQERKDRADDFIVKRNGELVKETINRIDYTFWFGVVREQSRDTVWISVPLEVFQEHNIGDRL